MEQGKQASMVSWGLPVPQREVNSSDPLPYFPSIHETCFSPRVCCVGVFTWDCLSCLTTEILVGIRVAFSGSPTLSPESNLGVFVLRIKNLPSVKETFRDTRHFAQSETT